MPIGRLFQRAPVGANGLEQRERANDIGLDELTRAVDGTINVTFGREMHHARGL